MRGYELRNGVVLATCEYLENTSSFDGSWFQKQCDDNEKATGCSKERKRKEGVSGGKSVTCFLGWSFVLRDVDVLVLCLDRANWVRTGTVRQIYSHITSLKAQRSTWQPSPIKDNEEVNLV
jgi:hypothetical protein